MDHSHETGADGKPIVKTSIVNYKVQGIDSQKGWNTTSYVGTAKPKPKTEPQTQAPEHKHEEKPVTETKAETTEHKHEEPEHKHEEVEHKEPEKTEEVVHEHKEEVKPEEVVEEKKPEVEEQKHEEVQPEPVVEQKTEEPEKKEEEKAVETLIAAEQIENKEPEQKTEDAPKDEAHDEAEEEKREIQAEELRTKAKSVAIVCIEHTEDAPTEKKAEPTSNALELFTGDHLQGLDVKSWLMTPIPKGKLVQCQIVRDKGGLLSYPKYSLYLSHKPVFLMAAKKQSGNTTSNFAVCMNEKDISKKAAGYLGKIRANFSGTEYHIYDDGANPTEAKAGEKIRSELGGVKFEMTTGASVAPRKMTVLTPDIKADGGLHQFQPKSEKESILIDFAAGKKDGMRVFYSKEPTWNEKAKAYILNFNGRVKKASVKNFQIAPEGEVDTVALQFGRVDDTHFIVDFQWPLTPFQAFAISLSSFDSKFE